MLILKKIRQQLTTNLWHQYKNSVNHAKIIESALITKGEQHIPLDHFAIIDLPGKHSGIPVLSQIFSSLGYIVQGHDYLPEKQNEFLWLAEVDAMDLSANKVLPQVVIADFWLEKLPMKVRKIIQKYTAFIPPPPLREIQHLSGRAFLGDADVSVRLLQLLTGYFSARNWPLPTVQDFNTVFEANELLAWVLVSGRRPNHFTIATHLLQTFDSFSAFTAFIEQELHMPMNHKGGLIKGNARLGIEQSSTAGEPVEISLADGNISIPDRFIEFVWRYPNTHTKKPSNWNDFYTGFIAQNANRVIESVYTII